MAPCCERPRLPTALVALPLLAAALVTAVAAEPETRRPTDEARGEQLYETHCEACHGARNGGKGPATEALVHPVPDLQGKVVVDDATVEVVLRGRGAMPGYEQTFDRFDARRVLAHMAKLGPDFPPPEPPAEPPAPAAPPG